jgi:hypothetical protein
MHQNFRDMACFQGLIHWKIKKHSKLGHLQKKKNLQKLLNSFAMPVWQ